MATILADPVGRQTEALSKGQTPAVQAAAFSGAAGGGGRGTHQWGVEVELMLCLPGRCGRD